MPSTGPHLDHAPSAPPQSSVGPEKLPGIKHIIAVASGKGGVGIASALPASRPIAADDHRPGIPRCQRASEQVEHRRAVFRPVTLGAHDPGGTAP